MTLMWSQSIYIPGTILEHFSLYFHRALSVLGKIFSRQHFKMFFFFFFPENSLCHFMQIVSLEDNLYEIAKPILLGKLKEIGLFDLDLTLLSTIFQSYRNGVWMWQGAQCSLLECCLTETSHPRHFDMAGLGGSVGCAVRLETRRSRVQPPPRSATFFRGDWSWNIFYDHSLPSADSRRAVVSFWRKNVHNTG